MRNGPLVSIAPDSVLAFASVAMRVPDHRQPYLVMRWVDLSSSRRGLETHRDPVHAVAQPGDRWAIIEHMAQMPTTTGTVNRRPHHAKRRVAGRADRGVVQRCPETR